MLSGLRELDPRVLFSSGHEEWTSPEFLHPQNVHSAVVSGFDNFLVIVPDCLTLLKNGFSRCGLKNILNRSNSD